MAGMSTNPPDLRPDLARARVSETRRDGQPTIGMVSLGCPKALVDSEQILTQLRAEGYDIVPTYHDSDLVVVNTCGFIDSAVAESLDAIGEAIDANGRVIVTGCMGTDEALIRDLHPRVLAVTGPAQYERVLDEIHRHAPPPENHDPFTDLVPPQGIKLTPRHYAYLKISEGCNNKCTFCIIPDLRGRLVSRPVGEVMDEAERLASSGVRELLVISQDTSAYGVDLKYRLDFWGGRPLRTRMRDLCEALGSLGIWIRLHYVYPYPHVDDIIPLMAEGMILPYLDVPFQHAHPETLRRMARPAAGERGRPAAGPALGRGRAGRLGADPGRHPARGGGRPVSAVGPVPRLGPGPPPRQRAAGSDPRGDRLRAHRPGQATAHGRLRARPCARHPVLRGPRGRLLP